MANQTDQPTAIITGAASGIANGLAKTLIQLEWSLVLADLNFEAMKNDFRECAPERVLLHKLDVTKVILKAIRTKPLEISLPKSRGFISKIGGCFPWLLMFLSKSLSNKGIKNISKLRDGGAV